MGENELLLFLLLTWAAAIVGGIWAYNSPKNYAPKKEKAEPPAPQGVPGYAETALYYNPRRLNNSPPEPVEYKSVEVKPPQPDNRVHVKAKLAMALEYDKNLITSKDDSNYVYIDDLKLEIADEAAE